MSEAVEEAEESDQRPPTLPAYCPALAMGLDPQGVRGLAGHRA